MSATTLQLTRIPRTGRQPLLCIPGTYCSPIAFEQMNEDAFPELQLLPVSWMTSPGPWDIQALGQRVARLLRELDLGPVLLAGHSTGGPIALVAALTEPSLVSGLLLIGTGANTHGHEDITSIIKFIEAGADARFFDLLLQRSFATPPDPALLQRMQAYACSVPREAALAALTSQATLDLSNQLPEITVPAVIVHGRYDRARPIAHAELLARRLPHAELRLLDTGHTPMLEAPEEYALSLRRLCTLTGIMG